MTNYPFKSVNDFNDVSVKTTYNLHVINGDANEEEFIHFTGLRSRDNARTIMSWDDSKHAGFSKTKPWFNVCPDYTLVNVKKKLNR